MSGGTRRGKQRVMNVSKHFNSSDFTFNWLFSKQFIQLSKPKQWFYFRANAHRRLRRITWPSMSSQGGLETYWMRTCCFRMLFWTYSWMCKKLRWYPQQPQRSIFTNFSEACCEAKRWKHLSVLQSLPDLLWNLLRNVEPDLALHQSLPEPSPEPSPESCWT